MKENRSLTVLFSSAGRRVELINCFRREASDLGVALRVLTVDLRPDASAACQAADASWAVPRCAAPEYVPKLLEICERERVALLVPTIDTELEILAERRRAFEEIGTAVAISSPDVVRLARNKLETARFLKRHELPVPRTAAVDEFLSDTKNWRWPVILKPISGSCSIGIKLVRDESELAKLGDLKGDYIAQEFHSGREYTVNIFFDGAGKLRCSVPHLRVETRAGEVSKGITERHPELLEIARRFGDVLPGARGALCFQAIIDEAGVWMFELNARFGGGYPLAHEAGGKFARWLLEECLGCPPSYSDEWTDGVSMLRYDAAVFRPQRMR